MQASIYPSLFSSIHVHFHEKAQAKNYRIKLTPPDLKTVRGWVEEQGEKRNITHVTYDFSLVSDVTKAWHSFLSSKILLCVDFIPKEQSYCIALSPASQPSLATDLEREVIIKGLWKKGSYKLKLSFDQLEKQSRGWVKINNLEKTQVTLDLNSLLSLTIGKIKRLLISSPSLFRINILENREGYSLKLDVKEDAPLPQNAVALADALKAHQDNPLLLKLADNLIEGFKGITTPTVKQICEIAALMDGVNSNQARQIVEALLQALKQGITKDPSLTSALTSFFVKVQKTYDFKVLAEALKKPATQFVSFLTDSPLNLLNSTQLTASMLLFIQELENIKTLEGTEGAVISSLEAVVALLDVMNRLGVKGIQRKERERWFKQIARFTAHPDLYVTYLARHAEQGLTLIPNDESKAQSAVRRTGHVLKGLAIVAGSLDLKEPWHAIQALQAIPEFQRAIADLHFKEKWFNQLASLRFLINAYSHSLTHFKTALLESKPAIKIDFQNPFLLRGFIDALWGLLKDAHVEPEKGQTAILFLEQVWYHNKKLNKVPRQSWHYHPNEQKGLFTIKEENLAHMIKEYVTLKHIKKDYAANVCDQIINYLYTCTSHPSEAIRCAAKESLDAMQAYEENVQPFQSTPVFKWEDCPTDLFNQAIKTVIPLMIRQTMQTMLEKDIQVKLEQKYYLPLYGQLEKGPSKPLRDHVLDFVSPDNPNRVLLISGESGAGKSLFSRLIALELFHEYDPQGLIIVFVSLPSLTDPYTGLISESLCTQCGIKPEDIPSLKQQRFLFICDAYDEIHFDKDAEGQKQFKHLYESNRLQEWTNAKVIFTCKEGVVSHPENYFKPLEGELEKVQTCLFTDEQISTYLENYAQRSSSEWKPDDYQKILNYLKEQDSSTLDLIKNPWLLRVTAEALPYLIEPTQNNENIEGILGDFITNGTLELKLYDIFACLNAERARRKFANVRGAKTYEAENFIDYSIQVAQKMEENQIFQVKFPYQDQLIKDIFGEIINQSQLDLMKECLVKRNNQWGFFHDDYRQYFTSFVLGNLEERKTELRENLPKIVKKFN